MGHVMTRRAGWIGAYADLIDETRAEPFAWGRNDCAVGLCARVVEVLTGVNPASRFAGQFDDAASAYRIMRAEGFEDLADLVASILPEYDHPSEAQIGDLVAVANDTPFRHALGVCNGERIFVLTETGLGTLDRRQAVRAFKVG